MARIFVPPEKLLGEHATLDAAAHRHLVKVLRLAPGAGTTTAVLQGRASPKTAICAIEGCFASSASIHSGETLRPNDVM